MVDIQFSKNSKINHRATSVLRLNLFWLLSFFSFNACAIGEISPVYPPVVYRFHAETVWDKLNITVEDQNGHFKVICQSNNVVNGWTLSTGENDNIIARSDKSSDDNFEISVDTPFTPCELTVLVNNDAQEIPMVVSLSPDTENVWITPTPSPTPSETRVVDLLNLAQKLEIGQNSLEALKLYLVVLKIDPHNKTAQAGLARIQDAVLAMLIKKLEHTLADHDAEASQSVLAQIKKLNPADKRIAGWQLQIDSFSQNSTQSRKAKADEAYNLGLDSYRKDDFSSAKKFWEETLQIDPNYLQARQNLDRLTQEHPGL
jgi:hypothetical protein